MLTIEQKQTFFEKGYLLLPGTIGEAAAGFEDFVWSCLAETQGIRRDDPATWNVDAPWAGLKNYKEAEILQAIGSPQLCAAIDDLIGPETWNKPRNWGGFLVDFPNTAPEDWYIPNGGWHVDFHYTHDPEVQFGIRVFTFLSEVEPRGGGTLVVAGAHRAVANYVRGLSEAERTAKYAKVQDRFLASDPWLRRLSQEDKHSPGRIEALMEDGGMVGDVPVRVEQFCGRPGDVVLMHPWLLHVRSPHSGRGPRFMLAKGIYTHASRLQTV